MYLSWTGIGACIHADAWACLCVSVWRSENHLGFSCFTSINLPTPIFKRSRSFTDLELAKCAQFVGQKPSGITLSPPLLGFALGLQAHNSRLRILCQLWDSNLCLHACIVSTLSSELYPQNKEQCSIMKWNYNIIIDNFTV